MILGLLSKTPEDRPASGDVVAQLLREEIDRESRRGGSPAILSEPESISVSGTQGLVDTPETPWPSPATPPQESAARPVVKAASALVREMLETVLLEPITLSADDRYLCGHYLAYLLGGSRRTGIFLQQPSIRGTAGRAALVSVDDLAQGLSDRVKAWSARAPSCWMARSTFALR